MTMKEEALRLIRKIRVASKDHYNDGWMMAGFKKDLEEIKQELDKYFQDIDDARESINSSWEA